MRTSILLGAALVATSLTSSAQADVFYDLFGCRGDPCLIRESTGGNVVEHLGALNQARSGAKQLFVIDGMCPSACAMFADDLRSDAKVCVTQNAKLGFHKVTRSVPTKVENGRGVAWAVHSKYDPTTHSRDIDGYVRQNGGYPANGLTVMSSRDATRFFRKCTVAESTAAR